MGGTRWHRPLRTWVPAIALIHVTGSVICLLLFLVTGSEFYPVVAFMAVVTLPFGLIKLKGDNQLEWPNAYRRFDLRFHLAFVGVHDALKRAGVHFRMKGREERGIIPDVWYYDELVLDGVTVTFYGDKSTWIYIGPVDDDTRRDVEWLKGLVDEAMGAETSS